MKFKSFSVDEDQLIPIMFITFKEALKSEETFYSAKADILNIVNLSNTPQSYLLSTNKENEVEFVIEPKSLIEIPVDAKSLANLSTVNKNPYLAGLSSAIQEFSLEKLKDNTNQNLKSRKNKILKKENNKKERKRKRKRRRNKNGKIIIRQPRSRQVIDATSVRVKFANCSKKDEIFLKYYDPTTPENKTKLRVIPSRCSVIIDNLLPGKNYRLEVMATDKNGEKSLATRVFSISDPNSVQPDDAQEPENNNDDVLLDLCPDSDKTTPGVCGCDKIDLDSDNDGLFDCIDDCQNDPLKIKPGICGCGVADTDNDGDRIADCTDGCPSDPEKTAPGACGCGVADSDTDGDKTSDCNDKCPTDQNKTEPGTCGCDVPDADSDRDGTLDCNDNCASDPSKVEPGICGCGVADTDLDNDGTPDCNDQCPEDPTKTEQGTCGCGVADTDLDNDGTPDCNDQCPEDQNKTEPDICGCGVADTDSDGDGTPDCNDQCPEDSTKTEPGTCECGVADTDSDGDGIPDCNDQCSSESAKTEPGICGCNTLDTDSDKDEVPDCIDQCEEEDDQKDEDKNEIPDCLEKNDYDRDGLSDYSEGNKDTDEDGVPDFVEPNGVLEGNGGNSLHFDTDGDGVANNEDPDDDGDGILTSEECPTQPCRDTDKDGVPDYLDHNFIDTDGDGIPNFQDSDDDGDGTPTISQIVQNIDCPFYQDEDLDSVPDHLDSDRKTKEDSDGDKILDKDEYFLECNKENQDICGKAYDSDKDGDNVPDHNDACNTDPEKWESQGECGCQEVDTDSDKDGTADCNDECQDDKNKTAPGICGCGTPDTDSDNDGTPDCKDQCSSDPNKVASGICGCGIADTDSDNDGTPDCNDQCSSDSNKINPGICGCGIVDADSDNDGTPDCNDNCANDSNKIEPGICGCGIADTDSDGDGTPDCNDQCSNDPNKVAPGNCGCGIADTDSDKDGTPDCNDNCPNDPSKTEAGSCGCGIADTDSDGDGTADCQDNCPNDKNKIEPGQCGCGVSANDCADMDLCPEDDNKLLPGVCGCGIPDTDENKDGVIDCDQESAADESGNNSPFSKQMLALKSLKVAELINSSTKESVSSLRDYFNGIGLNADVVNIDPKNVEIEKETQLNLMVNLTALAKTSCQDAMNPFFDTVKSPQNLELAQAFANSDLPYDLFAFETPETITAGALSNILKDQTKDCKVVTGVADILSEQEDPDSNANFNDPNFPNQNYLKDIKYEQSYEYFKDKATEGVTVAFIDTGFDLANNTDAIELHDLLAGSNLVESFDSEGESTDIPQDTQGHGTEVASIVAAKENNGIGIAGIVGTNAKVLPIRILRDKKSFGENDNGDEISSGGDSKAKKNEQSTKKLFYAIRHAVNAGAKIVNISVSELNAEFCNPVIGEAIYRAIEKDVSFIFSAGNGYPDSNDVLVPIELKGPTDHGPQQFGKTLAPACWGEYFKGAVTVAALNGNSLSPNTNFGQVVEMSAPGTNITTTSLAGASVKRSGTSYSAPIVTAAATLIYSAFKADNRYISPWLLEDILLNGSPEVQDLLSKVNDGKIIDLKALSDYLAELDQMTEEQRRRIPSKNQNVGDGWDPEKDIERIAEIIVNVPEGEVLEVNKNKNLQMTAFIRYFDGTLIEITNDPTIYWTAQYQPVGKTSIEPKTGLLSIPSNSDLEQGTSININAHYGDYQGSTKVLLIDEQNLPKPETLAFEKKDEIVWGEIGSFKVLAKYQLASKKITRNVTNQSSVTSSKADELEITPELPGYFRTIKTFGGKSYKLNANFNGLSTEATIKVLKREQDLQIRNTLGDPFKGQSVVLRAVLENSEVLDELPVFASWRSLTQGLQLNIPSASEITIPTDNLTLGEYRMEAKYTPFRGRGSNETLTKVYTFRVKDSFDRIQLLTKTPIINFEDRAVFSLRFFTSNNSYTVIDPSLIRWSTSSRLLPIDQQGIVYPTKASLVDGQGTTYQVFAEYLGRKSASQVRVVSVNEVTGNKAVLSHLTLKAEWDNKLRCTIGDKRPECNSIQVSGVDHRITWSVSAHYSDGQIRDVSRYASIYSNFPQKLAFNGSVYTYLRPHANPGDLLRVSALYEGESASRLVEVLPLTKLEVYQLVNQRKSGDFPKEVNPGETMQFSNARNFWDLYVVLKGTDVRGREGGILSGLTSPRWTSNDQVLVNASRGKINGDPINNLYVYPKLMTPDFEHPISFNWNYNGFGFKKDLTADFRLQAVPRKPIRFTMKKDIRDSNNDYDFHLPLEGKGYLVCVLHYPANEKVTVNCSEADTEIRYADSNQIVEKSGYKYTSARNTIVAWGPENIDRIIDVQATHRATGLKSSEKIALVGIENFSHQLKTKPFPSENPGKKQDDPFCNLETKSLLPVAGGTGLQDDPFLICAVDQLRALEEVKSILRPYYIKLMANLDFSKVANMRPIEGPRKSTSFYFDGNGYQIANYTVIDREANFLGLFRKASGVSNLILVNPTIRGDSNVGALLGHCYACEINNITIIGGTVWGTKNVGGVVGDSSSPSNKTPELTTRPPIPEPIAVKSVLAELSMIGRIPFPSIPPSADTPLLALSN
jgi:hypothetical protein